jgi:hypothetical protein
MTILRDERHTASLLSSPRGAQHRRTLIILSTTATSVADYAVTRQRTSLRYYLSSEHHSQLQ